jgi:hypothetical protein
MPLNQKGIGIVGILIAAAILGGLAVELTALISQVQSSGAKTRAHVDADALVKQIQHSLLQPGICDGALKNAGAAATYNPALQNPVTSVDIPLPGGVGTTTIATIGQGFPDNVTPRFTIQSMVLRAPNAAAGETTRPAGQVTRTVGAGPMTTYTTATAKLELTFNYMSPGAADIKRSTDLILVLDGAGNVVTCSSDTMVWTTSFDCDSVAPSNLYPTMSACPVVPAGCSTFKALVGFDGLGHPKCACLPSCQAYYKGPTGTPLCRSSDKTLYFNGMLYSPGCNRPAIPCTHATCTAANFGTGEGTLRALGGQLGVGAMQFAGSNVGTPAVSKLPPFYGSGFSFFFGPNDYESYP